MTLPYCTRLAPSPTGPLHLGNACTFLLNWALGRTRSWRIILRHEDLDYERVGDDPYRPIEDALGWLGIDWDGPVTRQRDDLAPYRSAMKHLDAHHLIFACDLSRSDIRRATSAPHTDDPSSTYPAHLRPTAPEAWAFTEQATNYRLKVDAGTEDICDELWGTRPLDPSKDSGDFVVWTKSGMPSYQLAVVVDDAASKVTDVVRGDDLLDSSARQMLLYRHLGCSAPRWWHVPLVYGPDGKRLAKRNGGGEILRYRDAGVPRDRVIGLIAYWCGITTKLHPLSTADFMNRMHEDILKDMVRRERNTPGHIVFTEQEDRWLIEGSPQ